MRRFLALILTIPLLFAAGCGKSGPVEVFDVRKLQGKVDASLPLEAQAKQEALRRLLNGLQEGIGEKAALDIFVPGVDYQERFEDFYDGAKRLVRWEFNGPPNRDEVPVVLFFDDLESGPLDPTKERRTERVYVVEGTGPRFTISRRRS